MNWCSMVSHKATAICIWGTASNVGKSLFTAGLGRLLNNKGYSVAPFKAQNMSNNSAVTVEGGEIGRAQACQAEACRVPVCHDLNPLLLKPSGDTQSQVVMNGTVNGSIGTDFGEKRINEFKNCIAESYDRLSSKYDVILIEGAGGCAELNLRHRDLANLWFAEYANAHVILISDIERGGIFASILGTLDLLKPDERERIIGFVVNKFRGAKDLFTEGVRILENRSGIPVLGVLPHIPDHRMPDEDNASFEARNFNAIRHNGNVIRVGVIMPPHVSNITDVEPLIADPRFQVQTLYTPLENDEFDILLLPGSKNVIDDLIELKHHGFEDFIKQHTARNGLTIGVCGGYQMLGRTIIDPMGIESQRGEIEGFSLLRIKTELVPSKVTENVQGTLLGTEIDISGYEIHCGRSSGEDTARPLIEIHSIQGITSHRMDGIISENGRIWGTYLHGLFDNEGIRDCLCRRFNNYTQSESRIPDPYEAIASVLACHLNLDLILNVIDSEKQRLSEG